LSREKNKDFPPAGFAPKRPLPKVMAKTFFNIPLYYIITLFFGKIK
jgi:hypothetical protein